MCRVSLPFADALDFSRTNYLCIPLVKEGFPRVEMPPPDFSANGQIVSFLPFCPRFSNGRGFSTSPLSFLQRWGARRLGEIPPSTVCGSRCGSTAFE